MCLHYWGFTALASDTWLVFKGAVLFWTSVPLRFCLEAKGCWVPVSKKLLFFFFLWGQITVSPLCLLEKVEGRRIYFQAAWSTSGGMEEDTPAEYSQRKRNSPCQVQKLRTWPRFLPGDSPTDKPSDMYKPLPSCVFGTISVSVRDLCHLWGRVRPAFFREDTTASVQSLLPWFTPIIFASDSSGCKRNLLVRCAVSNLGRLYTVQQAQNSCVGLHIICKHCLWGGL